MNVLIVGSDKTPILKHLRHPFLFIDDGDLCAGIKHPPRRKVLEFDVSIHSFNPLKDIDYKRARDFAKVLDAAFPEGANTLTTRNARFTLLKSLLDNPSDLETLVPMPDKKDTGATDAYQKIQTLLLSPVLKDVLTRPTNMSFKGTIVAKLNRAELGDFDCFILAQLLISLYPGLVVIPDYGFYACGFHGSLFREKRMVVGINSFAEAPEIKQRLLLSEQRIASRCTADDAKILAPYAGLTPGTNEYNDFIETCIGRTA